MDRKKHILFESPSYKFNKDLNSVIKTCNFCSSCDRKQNIFYEHGFKILCYYFAKNLEKIHYGRFDEALNDKRCNDVFYWLHDILINTYGKNISGDDSIVQNFKEVWDDIIETNLITPKEKLCESSFDRLKSFIDHKYSKDVSDYCENYIYIQDELKKEKETCSIFYHYLTHNSKLYEEKVSKCSRSDKKYCLKYNKCHEYDPKELIKTDKCKRIEKSILLEIQLKKDAENLIQCNPGSECVEKDYINTSIAFSDHRFITLVVLSIWAIFLSLYFLYKLTPFRSWLNNSIYKKNLIRKNVDEEEYHDLLESDSEDAPIKFNNREYRITYNHD
ncbi:Plasmodium vivax Vir protein, putative [Plasmodium ovale]|uniref:Plasmodium vivax Vir protein, putative n=1 Tax=Plasmodium ovale TaxID=36330 RepID=A0A1C3KIU5_PLAOA|nr:Plasmodium vivax Vir protein, putative [Plasmodium ovale]